MSKAVVNVEWTEVPKTRDSGYSGVLGALEDRMPAQHPYRDASLDTWAHETTHGLNSVLRNKYTSKGTNAFFVPDRWCAVVQDPRGTLLSHVAQAVPSSWRGMSYDLYLRRAQGDWNDTPSYVCDEWTAYTNCVLATKDAQKDQQPSSVQQMVDFMGYGFSLASLLQPSNLLQFILWMSLRTVYTLRFVESSVDTSNAKRHLNVIRTSPDGINLRGTLGNFGGNDWSREVLG